MTISVALIRSRYIVIGVFFLLVFFLIGVFLVLGRVRNRNKQTLKIFISYRREDSAPISGRIYDRLVAAFSKTNVFKDVDTFRPGSDFRAEMTRFIEQCNFVLLIIGSNWLGIDQLSGLRRIDNFQDFVRVEIELCLQKKIQ